MLMTDSLEEQNEALLNLFSRFDTDGDRLIDEGEFLEVLRTLGENPSDKVLSLEFAVIDTDSDGMVTFREFKEWWLDYEVGDADR